VSLRDGDRVRVKVVADDGFPSYRYGFVGGLVGPNGPATVLLDDELGPELVPLHHVEPVEVTTLDLELPGLDLCQDAALRRGLVAMWQAEAETAGLAVERVVPMGDGVRDDVGSWALAELTAGGERFVLRASSGGPDGGVIHVRASAHPHWEG
jgi:hypothetical protein